MAERESLLNVEQLASRLNVPKSWVYARTRENGPDSIPRVKLGKYVRFKEAQVSAWLEKQALPGV